MSLERAHNAPIKVQSDGLNYDRYFPAPDWRETVLYDHMRAPVVVASMNEIVCDTAWQTAQIAPVLARESGGTRIDLFKRIWTFVRTHLQYEVEDGELLREPARAWAERKGDCDCFSIFTASILTNLGIPFFFRIAKYHNDEEWQHVYVIASDEYGGQIIIDCCLNIFNAEKPYARKQDFGGTCGLSGPEDDFRTTAQDASAGTGEGGTDEDSAWKKIATKYTNVFKDKGKEAADNAILQAANGNFNSLVDTKSLTNAAQGILGDLLGMAAGVGCGALGVPAPLCAGAAKIIGDIIQPGLFSIFGWSSSAPKTEETKWAELQSSYTSKWLTDNKLASASPSKRSNVRNDFNRLFGTIDDDGTARKFGLINGIQLFVVFRCYLQTIIDNYDVLINDPMFKGIDGVAGDIRQFALHRSDPDYDRDLSTFAFYRLFGAERTPYTLDFNPLYHKPGDETSRSIIVAILAPKNFSTFGFSENVLPLATRFPALKKCLLEQPAAVGLLGVWKTIRDSFFDWNRVETLTKQLQANIKSQLDDPDSPLNQEIKKQLGDQTVTPPPPPKKDNTTQTLLVGSAAVGLAFLAIRRIKTPLK